MNRVRRRPSLIAWLAAIVVGCSNVATTEAPSDLQTTAAAASHEAGPSVAQRASHPPAPAMTFPADVRQVPDFTPLQPGRYFIDADMDPARSLRVDYTVPDGWNSWIGAFRNDPRPGHALFDASMSIVMVTNLVRHGCTDHTASEPPVGPLVAELADALVALEPFKVVVQPRPVVLAGFGGTYVELQVPEDFGPAGSPFGNCTERVLKSWIGPPLSYAYYGYHAPGQREGFWILDVGGQRLVVEALWVDDVLPDAKAQLQAILDSIEITEGRKD
jgi:hypothetical protein